MEYDTDECWKELCAQAAVEPDPAKLFSLVKEINRLLEEKERRLNLCTRMPLVADGSSVFSVSTNEKG
jgi:hypothetical protein